jgi:legumain
MFPLFAALASSARWAVLYIGSNTYSNYRHHANIDTAYQLLVDRGFDKSHIIVAQYNDIPESASNPFKGQLFHTLEHINVYIGADAITYSGKKITAQLMYDIVSGREGLQSTAEDDVFVYYDNHGGPGILGVPDGVTGKYIEQAKLAEAFKELEDKKMYKNLFFMIGACYSLSMTPNIKNKNMAIITSANDRESSYACTYDSSVRAYLTNEFNLNFDLIARQYPDITIGEFYKKMVESNKRSHVSFAGDESMKSMKLSTFIGEASNKRPKIFPKYDVNDVADPVTATLRSIDSVEEYRARSKQLVETKERFKKLASAFSPALFSSNYNADYMSAIEHYELKFGAVHPDDLGEYQLLANLVQKFGLSAVKKAIDALD